MKRICYGGCRAMLSSICSSRACILAWVKFRSRALTALNLLPSIATLASLNSSRRRHGTTNSRQTLRIASPLSLRKSAIEVGHQAAGQPNQLDVALALPLQAPARLHPIEVSVDVYLQQRRRMIGRSSRHLWRNPAKAQVGQIKFIDKNIDRPDRIVLAQIVIQPLGKQRALTAVIANGMQATLLPACRWGYREGQSCWCLQGAPTINRYYEGA